MPMTDAEILNELGTDSLLNRVRRLVVPGRSSQLDATW